MSALALNRSNADDTTAELKRMKEQLTAYWNAVAVITANAHSITKASLQQVDPDHPPAWWTTLSTNFTSCQSHAQRWIDTIYPELTRIPQAIIDYNTYFQFTSIRIANLLAILETREPTEADKELLKRLLNLLVTKLAASKAEIEAVRAEIKAFTTNMAADHLALTTGSASIARAIDDSDQQVKRLEARIESLQLEVARLRQQLTASAVALGLSLFVGYVGLSVMPLIVIPIALIAVGVSIGFMTDAIVRLGKTQEEILADAAKLTKEKAQVVVLRAIASTVDALVKSIEDINQHIDVVSAAWATLDAKLKSVLSAITSARDEHWLDIMLQEIDIEASKKAWGQLEEFAATLQKVDLVVEDKTINIPKTA